MCQIEKPPRRIGTLEAVWFLEDLESVLELRDSSEKDYPHNLYMWSRLSDRKAPMHEAGHLAPGVFPVLEFSACGTEMCHHALAAMVIMFPHASARRTFVFVYTHYIRFVS